MHVLYLFPLSYATETILKAANIIKTTKLIAKHVVNKKNSKTCRLGLRGLTLRSLLYFIYFFLFYISLLHLHIS